MLNEVKVQSPKKEKQKHVLPAYSWCKNSRFAKFDWVSSSTHQEVMCALKKFKTKSHDFSQRKNCLSS